MEDNVTMQGHAINFLLYSYFGIAPEDEWELCVKKAIMKAYGDATMQGAYNTLFRKDLEGIDELKEKSKKAKNNAAKHLFLEIEKMFDSDGEISFEKWHETLCGALRGLYNDVSHGGTLFFTYGNAQKWVNMTIKYLCILDAFETLDVIKPKRFHEQINRFASVFHVPVDRYIIEAAKNKVGGNTDSWSKWDDNIYKSFQASLKELIGEEKPLEWEAPTWIGEAENSKKEANDKRLEEFFGEQ